MIKKNVVRGRARVKVKVKVRLGFRVLNFEFRISNFELRGEWLFNCCSAY